MGNEEQLGDVLSQSEVERLLAQVAEQENTTTVHTAGGEAKKEKWESIQPYDFRHPVFLSPSELRKLRLRHEEYIRALAARLSIHFRIEFGLQMSKLNTITYSKFIESLPNPTHLTLFKVEPLRGICILDINPRLGLTIVDRMMGGPAHSVSLSRDLSEIEVALLDQVIVLMLNEWCSHWTSLKELRLSMLGHESNGRFLQTASHDTVMLGLTMEARLGDCMEQIQIGFPYYTLEPLVRALGEELDAEAKLEEQSQAGSARWNRELEEMPVRVGARWENLRLSVRELSQLKLGDIVRLPEGSVQDVQVGLEGKTKFTGSLGIQNKRWAVCLKKNHKNS